MMRRLRKLLARVYPYWCRQCGSTLRAVKREQLTPTALRRHQRAGTLQMLLACGYTCPSCNSFVLIG